VYAEVMDALHQARGVLAPDDSAWALQSALPEYLEQTRREPDEGIREVRSGRRHFTCSSGRASPRTSGPGREPRLPASRYFQRRLSAR
jgi:hypothetical protein